MNVRHLLSVIAKTARPETLAYLLSDLISAEDDEHVSDLEFQSAQAAISQLRPVLDNNLGFEEACELIENCG